MSRLKILVAPLDWGLGHATRCIPIITELINRGCHVELAGSGNAGRLLQQEFPNLRFHHLPAYAINYPKKGKGFILEMIRQLPRLLSVIRKEHQWLMQNQEQEEWDLIISDNRYGLWHPTVRTVFMTHQLRVMSGWGKGFDRIIQWLHYRFINRFSNCWVPDASHEPGLAGELSHPEYLPAKTRYIGPLSRLENQTGSGHQIIVSLSGPEPQRTLLEEKLLSVFFGTGWEQDQILFLRGLPDPTPDISAQQKQIRFINHLKSDSFASVLADADLVICRSGYSSVMDLVRMQKKALLIPTPGQTEQEYLAHWLSSNGFFHACSQDEAQMDVIIRKAMMDPLNRIEMDFEGYKKALDDLGIQ